MLSDSSASKETWYVGLSRARKSATVVTDSKESLLKKLERSILKENAHDFFDSIETNFNTANKKSKHKELSL